MKIPRLLLTVGSVFAGLTAMAMQAVMPAQPGATAAPSKSVLDLTMKRIDGTEESLKAYAGKVVLFVNVASKCGYTKQYAGLEKLYESRKASGLVILGFPSNDFGGQEPGSNKEVAEFCSATYGVTFPMFEKISVKGDDAHELYKLLAAQPDPVGGAPKWNFTKYLVDRSGRVVAKFGSGTKPESDELTSKIDELLKAPVPAVAPPAAKPDEKSDTGKPGEKVPSAKP